MCVVTENGIRRGTMIIKIFKVYKIASNTPEQIILTVATIVVLEGNTDNLCMDRADQFMSLKDLTVFFIPCIEFGRWFREGNGGGEILGLRCGMFLPNENKNGNTKKCDT